MNTEPTLIIGAIRAVLIAAVTFGLDLSPEQIAAVLLAAEALLSLVLRSRVTPSEGI